MPGSEAPLHVVGMQAGSEASQNVLTIQDATETSLHVVICRPVGLPQVIAWCVEW